MAGKLDKLEALRGAAALYVVFHHTIPHESRLFNVPVGHLMRFGQEAVILFFLLSGFVINYSFKLSRNKHFGNYFAKRFCRIYIPLIAVMLISYFTQSYEAGEFLGPDIPALLGNLFMLQDWALANPNVLVDPYMGNGPLWSLSYEWWFYMLFFPLYTLVRHTSHASTIAFLVSIVASVVYIFYPYFAIRVFMYLAIWWAGAYVGELYLENRHRSFKALLVPCGVLTTIAISLSINVYLFITSTDDKLIFGLHPFNELRHFVFALMAIIGGWIWLKSGWIFYKTTLHHFRLLAPISYAIYICHDPIMREATYLSFIESPILRWLGYFSIMLMASYLIEILIYPRARRWLQPKVEGLFSKTQKY